MKISVSSFSFNQYLRDGRMTQIETVKKAAEMGFDGIEFISLSPCENPTKEQQLDYARQIKAEAEKYGIEIVAYCVGANFYHENEEDRAKAVAAICDDVDVAAELGAKILRHDLTAGINVGGRVISYDRQIPILAECARKVTEYAEKKGIRTCTENHGTVSQDSDRIERFYNAVAHDNFGVLVDVGNFACVDEDSVSAVSRLAPYAFHVHAKDFYITKFGEENPRGKGGITRGCNTIHGSVIGEGDIPVEQCIAILKKAGYDGYVTVEYECKEDCMEGIPRGLQNLRKYIM